MASRGENAYQAELIKKLKRMFPGCEILKNDPNLRQGILDLTIFWHDMWAMLEVKISSNAPKQANQDWYVRHFNEMSFAAFIFPENEEEVLAALQKAFSSRREACVS